ncbi:LysR family transcriptional regulator [Marinobacter sp. KMM 10035]|uniref:LysR family transcriptional regulator n=1 Tax=Marinobacter sp. KMM 10035 TaxID=3134034 RepID=UPI00397C01F7
MNVEVNKKVNLLTQISDIDFRQIRAFKAVVDCGGITAAELALNKGKSAISADISNLEKRLGIALCRRGRAGFFLTEHGQIIYDAVNKLLEDVEQFRQQIHTAQTQLTGRLDLYIADNAIWDAQLALPEVIASFHLSEPNVYLNICSGDPSEVEQAVLSGQAALGINVLPRQSASLNCHLLFKEDLFLYCGAGHPLFGASNGDLSIERLQEHEFIEVVTLHDAHLENLLADCKITASARNLDMRASMILSGKYLGFLPSYMAQHWTGSAKMRALMPSLMTTSNNVYAITNKSQSCNPARDIFLRVLNSTSNSRADA